MRYRLSRRLALDGLLWALLLALPWGADVGVVQAEVRNPDGVAVIVGNRNYSDVGDVAYAHRDAEAFQRYVVDVLGFDERNVRLVTDADFGKMRSLFGTEGRPGILGRFVEKRSELSGGRKVSDVVVFYSGHGLPSLTPGEAGSFLLAVDANPHDPAHNGYSVEELYRVLGALPARSVSVFLDACFSGVGGDGTPLLQASPAAVTRLPENVSENTVVFAAAEARQIALWDAENKHGLFTHHLLDALYGAGDEDGNKRVTAGEVERYLAEHVWYAALDTHGREQDTVVIDGTRRGDRVLAAASEDGTFPARPDLDDPAPASVVEGPDIGGGTQEGGSPSPPALDPAAVTGGDAFLVVETTPPGATVLVGGAKVGETPLERYDLRAGTYTVTLDHPTHETIVLDNQTLADKRVLSIDRRLKPATGSATVTLWPRAGWVEHDGERLADKTPVTLDGLPSGLLVLTLGAAGHRTVRVQVEVPKGGVTLVDQALEKVSYGTLTLVLEPADARVTLADGTPYQPGMTLAEGEHEIHVALEGYHEISRVVTVSGQTQLRITLEPDPQPFTVATTPAVAAVKFLDGSEAYRPGMKLLPGSYRVRVSAEGWEPQETAVRHGTTPTRHQVELTRQREPAAEEAAIRLQRSEKRLIQYALAGRGYSPGAADGLIGENTRKALRAWQEANGHQVTGYLTADEAKTLIAAGTATTSITVETIPPSARVHVFTSAGSAYRDGMKVQPGNYEIAVEAAQHEPFRQRLAVGGPTTYRISLCKLETAPEQVCELKSVTRTRLVERRGDKTISGFDAVTARELGYTAEDRADMDSEERSWLSEWLCDKAKEGAEKDLEETCERHGGTTYSDAYFDLSVTEEDCSSIMGSVRVAGKCYNMRGEFEDEYTDKSEDCTSVTKTTRNCPDNIVTKLR